MEVRSEPSFTMSMPKNLIVSQPSISGMRLTVTPDGTAVYKPISPIRSNSAPAFQDGSSPATLHGINLGSSGELVKKKRGRPRKYGHEGNMGLGLTSISSPSSAVVPPPGFSPLQPKSDFSAFDPTKKARGRPPGSLNKQKMLSLGSVGTGFTPHVITVKAGEDVSSKIMSFSQHGSRSICVLSANGAISNVTLRQAATSGGTVTYEGRFEILSLSGSFMISDNGGQRSRTGGLSVSLAGPDGRVLGGGVAGLLTAASPVQVVVGSFVADAITKELNHINHFDGLTGVGKLAASGNMYGGGVTIGGGNSPPSRGTLSGSSGGPPSPLNQGIVACNNNSQQGMPTISWK